MFTRTRLLVFAALLVGTAAPLGAGAGPASAAAAKTYTVNTPEDLPWEPDVCPKKITEKCSLRAAIEQANIDNANDTIKVPAGRYLLEIYDPSFFTDLRITAKMQIVGAGADSTIIDGYETWNVLTVKSGTGIKISKLTITGGGELVSKRFGQGGGVNTLAGTGTTFEDVNITRNAVTGPGGGILNRGAMTLTRVRVSENSSGADGRGGGGFEGHGAGIYNATSATLDVVDSTIDNNDGLRGSGINNLGTLRVTNSTISGNTARTSGGGIRGVGGSAQVKFSTITNNFSGSTKARTPGNAFGDPASWGGRNGGGVANLSGSSFTIGGSIVAGNSSFEQGPECFTLGSITSAQNNLVGPLSACSLAATASDRTGRNAQLGGLFVNSPGRTPTHAPIYGSEAIDGASTAFTDTWFKCPSKDQRGSTRPVARYTSTKICDIGAYEY